MAKGATQPGERTIKPGAGFLDEEHKRGRLSNGKMVMPRPSFVQPDNGTFTDEGATLGIHYDITKRPVKSGNTEQDISGGLY